MNITNGSQLINDNMPIQPENIILISGILLFIALIVFGISYAWLRFR